MSKVVIFRQAFDQIHRDLLASLKRYEDDMRKHPENYEYEFNTADAVELLLEDL